MSLSLLWKVLLILSAMGLQFYDNDNVIMFLSRATLYYHILSDSSPLGDE